MLPVLLKADGRGGFRLRLGGDGRQRGAQHGSAISPMALRVDHCGLLDQTNRLSRVASLSSERRQVIGRFGTDHLVGGKIGGELLERGLTVRRGPSLNGRDGGAETGTLTERVFLQNNSGLIVGRAGLG